MADLDEEIERETALQEEQSEQVQAEEEERRRQEELQAQAQQQRMAALRQQAANAVKNQIKKEAISLGKKAVWDSLLETSPYWGPVVGAGLLALVFLGIIILTPVVICNSSYSSDLSVDGAKLTLSLGGLCKYLKINDTTSSTTPPSGGGGATGTFGGLDIVITSAYRAGSIVAGTNTLSAHSRGEAVDIALRNPIVPIHGSDPRIAQLVAIAKSVGFTPAVGDTLDEYTTPTEAATGGHVHVEFNVQANGNTYCDNTPAATLKSPPPTDLVSLSGVVPVDAAASDPRVRPCMLTAVEKIFAAAAAVAPSATPTP